MQKKTISHFIGKIVKYQTPCCLRKGEGVRSRDVNKSTQLKEIKPSSCRQIKTKSDLKKTCDRLERRTKVQFYRSYDLILVSVF